MDPRHLQRIKTVQNLFAHSFALKNNYPHANDDRTNKIIKTIPEIDKLIVKYAPKYPIINIAKTDLSILRLSIYELLFEKKTPQKVVINEAVDLAKELSGEKSFGFVNAVLGKVLTDLNETK